MDGPVDGNVGNERQRVAKVGDEVSVGIDLGGGIDRGCGFGNGIDRDGGLGGGIARRHILRQNRLVGGNDAREEQQRGMERERAGSQAQSGD